MATVTCESPSTIRFCGTDFNLPQLSGDDFIDLFDAVIDHGCDLMELADYMPIHIYAQHAEQNKAALVENGVLLVLLDMEAERRKSLGAVAA